MALSRGALLTSIAGMEKFSLIHWPDFGVLGANPHHMKLSALFHLRELSIVQAAEMSKLSANVVTAFVNGCAALRLLKDCPQELMSLRAQRAVPLAKPKVTTLQALPSKRGFDSLIGRIRNALGI